MDKMNIKITKEWLEENKNKISKIFVPNYGKGFIHWIKDELISFFIEEDDGSFNYYKIDFDYVIQHKDEIVIYVENSYNLE